MYTDSVYKLPAASVLTKRHASIGFEPPQTSSREVSQVNLESNHTSRRNPFPDWAETHFLTEKISTWLWERMRKREMGSAGSLAEKEASICFPFSSLFSLLASKANYIICLVSRWAISWPEEAEPGLTPLHMPANKLPGFPLTSSWVFPPTHHEG